MSALTDLFQSMANKIRSKTGTATTYTPPQMVADGIDDVFDAGVASATTPITPSDSSPVAMSANTGYKPTTNGYAIANNPTSITPSNSSPVTISSGTIYKASGNGKAVETVQTITPTYGIEDTVQSGAIIRFGDSGVITKEIPTPSELTPSDSSPATITMNGLYSATGNGYAISSYNGLVPSDSSPVPLAGRQIYKITNGTATQVQGYAIESNPASKTPSDTSPAAVTSGSIIKPSSNGYLYKTQQTKSITLLGSITIADTSSHTVTFSQSIKNFRYCMVVLEKGSFATDKVLNNNTGGGCASVVFFDTDKWVSGFSQTGGYTTGGAGSQYTRDDIISYNSNTKMNIKHSQGTSRTDYIYGIN